MRIKIALGFLAVIFVLNIWAFMYFEHLSFIDALYFLIVTLSTVGYGEIHPKTGITKLLDLILIVTGISTIAVSSEFLIDKLVTKANPTYKLSKPLDYENHIVIAGFTSISENIAILLQERFFQVVVIDEEIENVERSKSMGFETYKHEIYNTKILKHLNISFAAALYLFLNDENLTVQSSLLAKSQKEDLLIYAQSDHDLSIEIGNLVGITRTYHYERLIASNMLIGFQQIQMFVYPNQDLHKGSKFRILQFRKEFDYQSIFDEYYEIGVVKNNFTSFTPCNDSTEFQKMLKAGNYGVLLVPLNEFNQYDEVSKISENNFITNDNLGASAVIIGGYHKRAKHIIEEIDPRYLQNTDLSVLVFDEDEYNLAKQDGFNVVFCKRESIHNILTTICKSRTTVFNLFERVTDSVLMNQVIKKLQEDVIIVQFAKTTIELEVFEKLGSDRIIIPDLIMTRGLVLILLAQLKDTLSILWGNAHLFELYIDSNSRFVNKSTKDLRKQDFRILLYQENEKHMKKFQDDFIMKPGDSLYLYSKHQFLEH